MDFAHTSTLRPDVARARWKVTDFRIDQLRAGPQGGGLEGSPRPSRIVRIAFRLNCRWKPLFALLGIVVAVGVAWALWTRIEVRLARIFAGLLFQPDGSQRRSIGPLRAQVLGERFAAALGLWKINLLWLVLYLPLIIAVLGAVVGNFLVVIVRPQVKRAGRREQPSIRTLAHLMVLY